MCLWRNWKGDQKDCIGKPELCEFGLKFMEGKETLSTILSEQTGVLGWSQESSEFSEDTWHVLVEADDGNIFSTCSTRQR